MKQEDKQYEKWLTELKSRQPILENPEELTMDILNSISQTTSIHKRRKYLIGAWLSGLVAAILLILFINDTYFSPVPQQIEKQNSYIDRQSNRLFPLPENWEEMKLQEKNMYLFSQYAQHQQLRQTHIIQLIKENRLK